MLQKKEANFREVERMFRTASVAVVAVLALGRTCLADTVYYCVPDEQRATAPDRLVSVQITLRPDGEFASVVYRAANGASYSRGQQYLTTNHQERTNHYWTGTLRANHNVSIIGSFHRLDGRLVYYESIRDGLQAGKIVAHVASACDDGHSTLAEAPSTPPPSASFPDREFKAFIDCVNVAAVALARISNEPAQTVVDAALGECPSQRADLANALERQGAKQSYAVVDGITKEARPNLLALVLNSRAAAAGLTRGLGSGAVKTEAAKGQPL